MNKLPQELRLIISREIKDQDWQLDNIMHALEDELKARERAVPHDECQLSGGIQGFSKAQTRSTTSALFAGHSDQDPLVHIVNRAIPLTLTK